MNITPKEHKHNNTYSKRRGRKRKTTEQFIAKARAVHKNKYGYNQVQYNEAKKYVTITCPVHGDFRQISGNHTQGRGCPSCGGTLKLTIKDFIAKAKTVHKNKYIYDKVQYSGANKPIIITCLKHGDFKQTPSSHTQGSGCPVCDSVSKRKTTKEFIEKAKAVHSDKYSYDKTKYEIIRKQVVITCLKHGDFKQRPNNHLQGIGCPACKSSKGELAIRRILEKHNVEFIQEYSIPNQNSRFKYDFYLPELNLLIEYHGAQHYIPIKIFGGEEEFGRIKIRDRIKRNIAKECKYKFLEIRYDQFEGIPEEEFEKRLLLVLSKTRSLALLK